MRRTTIAALAMAGLATAAPAQDVVTHTFDGGFDDATFAVENAIIGQGLVVDHVSHVGDMLARTRADVGGSETLFEAADVFLFCSAVVSREVMEADPMNIAHCPYGVFVADRGGEVVVGHRTYPEGAMQRVQRMLEEIVREAVGG